MDDPGQQTAEAYRPSRAKGDLLFFPNTSRPLFPAFFFFFLLQVLLFLSLSVSSHHTSHLVFTSLSQINHKSHNNINKLPQLNNTLPRTNTYTYVEYTGNMRLSELLSARVECSMKSVVNQHVIKCLRAPTMVQLGIWNWIWPRKALTFHQIDLFLFDPLFSVIN